MAVIEAWDHALNAATRVVTWLVTLAHPRA